MVNEVFKEGKLAPRPLQFAKLTLGQGHTSNLHKWATYD